MKKPTTLVLLFNGAALLIASASAIAMIRSIVMPDQISPCSERYTKGTQLSLERGSGQLLTAADLQARSGGTDWGLLENARVVQVKGAPAGQAIEVRLAKVGADAAANRNGMGFTWRPHLVHETAAACVTYSIMVSDGFDFAGGGRLPGLLIGSRVRDSTVRASTLRVGWREVGTLDVRAQLTGWTVPRQLPDSKNTFLIPRGQWISLEQEVVLNTPGEEDGIVRVWANGTLRFEKTGLSLRESADTKVSAVVAEAAADSDLRGAKSAQDRKVWLSSPELRWQ